MNNFESNTPAMPNPVSGSSLKLTANEKGMSWCLERLKKDMTGRKTRTLSIFQSVPLYYAALAVKRERKMTMQQRNAAVVKAYKYAAGAFLEWLQEMHDFTAPSWLTIEVMGCTTLSPQGEKEQRYFDEKRDTTWNRFTDMQRAIRSQWMPWVNKYLVYSQSSQGSLPSGTQEADMWDALHTFLWRQTASSKKKMTREEPSRRSGDGDGAVLEPSTAGTAESEAGGGADEETATETAPCIVPMPESWLHTFSLAFACFGRFSDHPDPDINLSASDGPPDASSEVTALGKHSPDCSDVNSSSDAGSSSRETLRGRIFADGTLSRAAMKRIRRAEKVKTEHGGTSTRLAEVISTIAKDSSYNEAISAFNGLKSEISLIRKQRSRALLYAEKTQEIKLRQDMGDIEGAKKAQARLLAMMETPIREEEVSSAPAGQGGGNPGLVQGAVGTSEVPTSRDAFLGASVGGSSAVPTVGGKRVNVGLSETGNNSSAPHVRGESCGGNAAESAAKSGDSLEHGDALEEQDVIDVTC